MNVVYYVLRAFITFPFSPGPDDENVWPADQLPDALATFHRVHDQGQYATLYRTEAETQEAWDCGETTAKRILRSRRAILVAPR